MTRVGQIEAIKHYGEFSTCSMNSVCYLLCEVFCYGNCVPLENCHSERAIPTRKIYEVDVTHV